MSPESTSTDTRTQSNRPPRILHFSDTENAYDHPERIGRLAGLVDAARDDRTLVVGAGDNTALGVLSLLTDDGRAQARPFFERVGHDADTFGNHDLDFGGEWAREWADEVPTTYLCANADGPGRDPDPPGSAVFERGGHRVGVVGLAHPETNDISGADIDFTFSDPVAAARREIRGFDDIDAVVVASHCGSHDTRIAAGVDADVVLGGHVHERRTERVDGTLLVRTAGNGTEVSEVVLGESPSVEYHDVTATDRVVGDLRDEYRTRREAVGADDVVARVDEPLRRTDVERFRGESRIGNFAADAFRAVADADVGVFPAGSLRSGPTLAGEVTLADVVGLCPFGGDVVELELPGAAVRRELEAMAEPRPDRGWVHCHLSGVEATWTDDDELHAVRVVRDGRNEPLHEDETYRVATAEYVVVVSAFENLVADDVVARHGPQYQVLVEHAGAGGLAEASLEGRISRVSAAALEGSE